MSLRSCLSLAALAGALLGGGTAAVAQTSTYPLPSAPGAADQAQPGAHHRNRMRAMLEQLNLSSGQRAKVASIYQNFRASRKTATPMTRKELRSSIAGILTADQRTKLQTMMREQRRSRTAPPPAAS